MKMEAYTTLSLSLFIATVSAILVVVEGLLPYEVNDQVVDRYPLPDLPYDYNGLEPYLDEATLLVHHTGHVAGYTSKLNGALIKWRQEVDYVHVSTGVAPWGQRGKSFPKVSRKKCEKLEYVRHFHASKS